MALLLAVLSGYSTSCGSCPATPDSPTPANYVEYDPSPDATIQIELVTVTSGQVVIQCKVDGVPTTVTYAIGDLL